LKLLSANLQHPDHHFWPDELDVLTALKDVRHNPTGHRQITDSYLVGIAAHHKGKVATLDSGLFTLAGHAKVEFIRYKLEPRDKGLSCVVYIILVIGHC
jgi:hypothetical protein